MSAVRRPWCRPKRARCRAPGAARSGPSLRTHCGALKVKNLPGRGEPGPRELEALVREPVAEMTADVDQGAGGTGTRVVVGTEAALRQVDRADVVAFLDLDQELLAPRYRAAEESLGLLVRAARLVGGRAGGGRLLLQTRQPQHEVVQAALLADPGRGRGRRGRPPAVSSPTRRPPPWPWCRARPPGLGRRPRNPGGRRGAGPGRRALAGAGARPRHALCGHGRRHPTAGTAPPRGRPPPPLTGQVGLSEVQAVRRAS